MKKFAVIAATLSRDIVNMKAVETKLRPEQREKFKEMIESGPVTGSQRRAPPVNSDAWVRDKVKATLLLHPSVNAGNTEIDFKDGIVTLRGNAASKAQKDLTTEYAMDVEGVKEVINEMTVPNTPKETPRTAGERIDDASITAQVKMALLFHRSTGAIHTTVGTKLGAVTVGGKAKNAAEKDLVTRLAFDVAGVISVTNQMVVE